MELEVTYDEFLQMYPPLKTEFFKLIPKVLSEYYFVRYRPPFLILSDNPDNFDDVDTGELLDLYDLLQDYKNIYKQSFHLIKQFFYITQFQEDFLVSKDGNDTGIMIFGPFSPKKVILLGILKEFRQNKYQFLKIMKGIKDNLDDFMSKNK
ncbi:hypothetical protein PPERSA_07817 [Pseudocohnilembus persalinus]|uniref:Uncharacterized protein n=1 Tax=Pseudocohnilembus persalinus TaxID=266149 RepID=A0A0V0QBV6_PSEPJ|nr:hypothetical protein PPERSA_07817 [Pseudocohnilembus persalinus]|eukprot:KRW99740.1 hypothetical protein PPERSA_07817 [Pseudocohnilembus persalinus]